MKKLTIIFVFLFTACVSKHTVISKGYGNTKDEALSNAKSLAIEKATGVWISTEQRLSGDEFSKKTNQASSGSIESYKILGESENTIEIEAVVVYRKDNSVKINSAFITNDDRERIREAAIRQEAKDKAAAEINDINKALIFDDVKVEIEPVGSSYTVAACGRIKYRQKWIDDFKDLGLPELAFMQIKHTGEERPPIFMQVDAICNGETIKIGDRMKINNVLLRHNLSSEARDYLFDLDDGICISFQNIDHTKIDEFRFSFTTKR